MQTWIIVLPSSVCLPEYNIAYIEYMHIFRIVPPSEDKGWRMNENENENA